MDMLTMAFWKSLKDSPEWVDVSPVSLKQDLGDEDVAAIEYQPQVEEVMGYMYAAMDLPGEGLDRALELSRKGILCNMSGYTAWRYRLKVLEMMESKNPEKPLRDEKFSEEILGIMPKNYQLWNHRRQVFEGKGHGKEELAYELGFAEQALEENTKSHHAWGHRQAVLADCDTYAVTQEVEFVDKYLDEDLHNNSAWAQRYFLLEKNLDRLKASVIEMQDKGKTEADSTVQPEDVDLLVENEVKYASDKLQQAPHNKAAWGYLLGLMGNARLANSFIRNLQLVFHLTNEVLKKWPSCSPAVDFMGQFYCKLFQMAIAVEDWEKARKSSENAISCWRNLQVLDPIRLPYYQHMVLKIERQTAAVCK